MEKNLPVYRMTIEDENNDQIGLKFVSFTDDPAIEVLGVALNNQVQVHLANDKQILAAPVLIPGQKIYRASKNEDGSISEYYITFTQEDIAKIYEDFMKRPIEHRFNLNHTSQVVKSAYLRGAWLIESKNDKSTDYGFDLPIGSLFFEVKVDDKEEWENLKANKMTGFSIEGVLNSVKLSLHNNNNNINKIEQMENKNELTPEVIVETPEVKLEETPVVEETAEVKAEITPEDIAMIWETLAPMVAEMIAAATKQETAEEAPEEDAEMTAVKSELEAVKAELSAVKESIASTPASKSISTELSSAKAAEHKKFEAKLENMKVLNNFFANRVK